MSGRWLGKIQAFFASDRIPWFIRGPILGGFMQGLGLYYDLAYETLLQGLKLGQPLRCDASALPVIIKDRAIGDYPNEPDLSKRYRAATWYQIHRGRGSVRGMLRHLQPYFLPAKPIIRAVYQDGTGASCTWFTIDASGVITNERITPSNWNWDDTPSKWARLWVIIYTAGTPYDSPPEYDDGGTYDAGGTEVYDGIPSQDAQDICNMILAWVGEKTMVCGVGLARDPASLFPEFTPARLPDGTTTLPIGNWGDVSLQERLASVSWIYDMGEN